MNIIQISKLLVECFGTWRRTQERRMGQEESRKTREKGGFPGGGNIMLRAKGTSPYGRREHITMDGESAMLRVEGRQFF